MGFQSCSRKMTVSAAVRFSPRPPTCNPQGPAAASAVDSAAGKEGAAGGMQSFATLCKSAAHRSGEQHDVDRGVCVEALHEPKPAAGVHAAIQAQPAYAVGRQDLSGGTSIG
jgi:Tfp pilus assembly protein FimV